MASFIWRAPHGDSTDNATTAHKKRGVRSFPVILLAGLLTVLLAACGTTPLPGIVPSENGNFILHFNPADAQVSVVEEGFEASGVSGHSASDTTANGAGILRYTLNPGRYRVQITKPGYRTVEEVVEVPESASEEEPAELSLIVELEPEQPASEDGSAGENGSGDPIGDSGAVVTPLNFSLRGDPNFSAGELKGDQRLWYERLRAAMRHPDQTLDATSMAGSDDAYNYGRGLYTHNHSLLLGLRATGD
ncbi:MAG: hypothetical protein WD273_08855, partial [Trueperaceae bacterium]